MTIPPGNPTRDAVQAAVQRVRQRLIGPDGALPSVEGLDADLQTALADAGGGRIGCLAIVIRYRILEAATAGILPPTDLARQVLSGSANLLWGAIRASDLLMILEPDALLVLAPGMEPLEGRGFQARLTGVISRQQLRVGALHVEVVPSFGYAYRGVQGPGPLDIPRLAHQARASATGASGTFRLPANTPGSP